MKKQITLLMAVFAFFWQAKAQYLTEDFETGALPAGWSVEYVSGTSDWTYENGGHSSHPAAAHSGNYNALFFVDNYDGDATKLVTPAMDLSAATNPQLLFWHAQVSWAGDQDVLKVYYKTSANGTWTLLQEWTDEIADWTMESIILPNPSADYYVAFEATSGYGYGVVLDDILVSDVTCPLPSNLNVDSQSATTADVSWTDNTGGNASYIVEWREVGATAWNSATTATGATSYQITGLTASTDYEWQLTADCGGGDTSLVISGPNFTTECAIYIPDYFEDFSTMTSSTPPACWKEGEGDESGPSNLGSSGWTSDDFANSGSESARFNLYNDNDQDWLITPHFDLSAGGYQVEFDVAVTTYSGTAASAMGSDDQVKFFISTDAGATWSALDTWDVNNTPSNVGDHIVHDLSTYTQTDVVFAFWANEGITDDPEDYNFYVDNFVVRTIPTCPEPTDLSVSNVTIDSAELSWADNNNGSATFIIEWKEAGTTTWNSATTATGATSYQLTGLNSNTTYEWQITADCGGGDTSNTITGETFTTFCNPVNMPWSESFEDPFNFECWHNTGTTSHVWEINDGTSYGPNNVTDGSQAIMFDVYHASRGATATAITPLIDMYGYSDVTLSFDFWMNGSADSDLWLKVEMSTDFGETWTEIFYQEQDGTISDWVTTTLDITGGNEHTAFKFTASSDYGAYNIFLDNIVLDGTAVVKTLSQYNFNFYPNPAYDNLHITADSSINSVQIFDLLGQEVLNVEINKSQGLIDTHQLKAGTYVIKINIDNNTGYYRFIKK